MPLPHDRRPPGWEEPEPELSDAEKETLRAADLLSNLMQSPDGQELKAVIFRLFDALLGDFTRVKTEIEAARIRGGMQFAMAILNGVEKQISFAKEIRERHEKEKQRHVDRVRRRTAPAPRPHRRRRAGDTAV